MKRRGDERSRRAPAEQSGLTSHSLSRTNNHRQPKPQVSTNIRLQFFLSIERLAQYTRVQFAKCVFTVGTVCTGRNSATVYISRPPNIARWTQRRQPRGTSEPRDQVRPACMFKYFFAWSLVRGWASSRMAPQPCAPLFLASDSNFTPLARKKERTRADPSFSACLGGQRLCCRSKGCALPISS